MIIVTLFVYVVLLSLLLLFLLLSLYASQELQAGNWRMAGRLDARTAGGHDNHTYIKFHYCHCYILYTHVCVYIYIYIYMCDVFSQCNIPSRLACGSSGTGRGGSAPPWGTCLDKQAQRSSRT